MTAVTPQSPKLKVAVGIASAGRPATLLETVTYIDSLEPRPARIIVCVPNLDDAGGLGAAHLPPGKAEAQRGALAAFNFISDAVGVFMGGLRGRRSLPRAPTA